MYNGNTAAVAQTVVELPSLVKNLLLLLSEKEKAVISKRFDLFGDGKNTLEQIGTEFSVTRERVRQIEKNALSKMRRNVFNTALKNIHDFASAVVEDNGGLIREETLLSELKALLPKNIVLDDASVHLSFVLHEKLGCVGNTINFHPYVRANNLPDYSVRYASGHLVNQLHKYGNVKSLEKLNQDLKKVFSEIQFDELKVRSLIDIDKRVTLLDNDMVGLLEWRHINPRTLRDKIMYILRRSKGPMHFSEIAEEISAAKFDNRPVNIQAVHNELIRHDSLVLIGRGIYALAEWGYESGTVSNVIEKILADGKELPQEKIVDLVLKKRQVKPITIVLALKNSDKFERVGRKMYRNKSK